VLTVKQMVSIERPSTLQAARDLVSGVRIRSASGVARDLLVGHPSVRAMAAGAPQLPQVHQVFNRAQQARAQAGIAPMAGGYGIDGTTGFRREDVPTGKQTLRVSGAPPRGRPV
jgi:hypothetical protein